MDSIVFVKQITQIYLHCGIDLKTKEVVKKGFVRTINPHDEVALECALRLKEASGKGQVTAVTLGPASSETVLRWAVALGANNAIHVLDSEDTVKDPLMVAGALGEVVREMTYDMLFFGKIALDDEYGLVGPYVSELLDIPIVTAISDLKVLASKKEVIVRRALERGNREEVKCTLPAAFTADMSLNRPRYPSFPGRKRASKKKIETIDAKELLERSPFGVKAPSLVIKSFAPPKIRPKKILSPDSGLSAVGRLKFVMGGGMGRKGGNKTGGNPDQTAESIFNFLKENNFLPEPVGKAEHN